MTKIAINGFGRIGRAVFKIALDNPELEVVDGDLVKVMSWYDNEWGYASQMVKEAVRMIKESKQTAS
ncbi:MAG: glyceraldehyde 3-phosphate dehydrogenase NAD-binding domain-containing protein [Coleofasciculus sp. D1-CHI-01]